MKFTVQKFNEILRDGKYVWPGGYPLYFICFDGEALSFEAAEENKELVIAAINDNDKSDWHVIGYQINWEDNNLYCVHTNNKIECAYPKDEDEDHG